MIRATVTLRGLPGSPYSQSRKFVAEEIPNETKEDAEERNWRKRMTTDGNGIVCIPAMALKKCLDSAAARLRMTIPGKGKSEYGKSFVAGVRVAQNPSIGIHMDDVEGEWFFVDAQGKKGGGRVLRKFPMIYDWTATVEFLVVDPDITQEVFGKVLAHAAIMVGIGRFRPENGGVNGQFVVESITWETV